MFTDMNRKIVDEILRFISQNQNVKRSYKKKKKPVMTDFRYF